MSRIALAPAPGDSLPSDGPDRRRAGWLFGPAVDLGLGCGLGYAALLLLLFFYQPQRGQLGLALPLLILVSGVPHYGATLLRVSATAEDRRRFARPALLLFAVVGSAFIAGLRVPRLGAALITLYLSLSPWHYAAQNYGITMLFLRRRGVTVTNASRRLLRLSFVASYGLVLLSYHQLGAGRGNDPLYAAGSDYRFLPLGLPPGLCRVGAVLCLLSYLTALALALRSFVRQRRLAALAPVLGVLVSQALWFSLPAMVSLLLPGRYPGQQLALAFVWIAIGHSVQYLWISTYYHRAARAGQPTTAGTGADFGGPGFLLRALLLGALLWVAPALLFAPGALGRLPFDAGLGLLIAAAVNLHHFALDGMIWRLRDPRVGAVLAGSTAPESSPDRIARRQRRGQPLLVTCALITCGGCSVAAWVVAAWESEVGHRRAYAARDLPRLELASQRLKALGRDGPQIHRRLARLEAQAGNPEAAIRELHRSLELVPTRAVWMDLGRAYQARGELAAAEAAYREALSFDTDTDADAKDATRSAEPSAAAAAE